MLRYPGRCNSADPSIGPRSVRSLSRRAPKSRAEPSGSWKVADEHPAVSILRKAYAMTFSSLRNNATQKISAPVLILLVGCLTALTVTIEASPKAPRG